MSAEKKHLPKEKAEPIVSNYPYMTGTPKYMTDTPKNLFDAKQYYYNPPNDMLIKLKLPKNIQSEKAILKYLWSHYHIDVTVCENCDEAMQAECRKSKDTCDNYMNLYYNADERSFLGWVEDNEVSNEMLLRLSPQYYAKGWEKEYWIPLLKHSKILEVDGQRKPSA